MTSDSLSTVGGRLTLNPSNRRGAIDQLHRVLGSIAEVRLHPHRGDMDPRSAVLCRFSLSGDEGTYRRDQMQIVADAESRLSLRQPDGEMIPLPCLDTLCQQIDRLRRRRVAAATQHRRQSFADRTRQQAIVGLLQRHFATSKHEAIVNANDNEIIIELIGSSDVRLKSIVPRANYASFYGEIDEWLETTERHLSDA